MRLRAGISSKQLESIEFLAQEAETAPQRVLQKLLRLAKWTREHWLLATSIGFGMIFSMWVWKNKDNLLSGVISMAATGVLTTWGGWAKSFVMPMFVAPYVQSLLFQRLMLPKLFNWALTKIRVPNTPIGQLAGLKHVREFFNEQFGKDIQWNMSIREGMVHILGATSVVMAMDGLDWATSTKGLDWMVTVAPTAFLEILNSLVGKISAAGEVPNLGLLLDEMADLQMAKAKKTQVPTGSNMQAGDTVPPTVIFTRDTM